jgi:hypothetical protein
MAIRIDESVVALHNRRYIKNASNKTSAHSKVASTLYKGSLNNIHMN